jgi:hypothetical protein
MGNSRWDSGQYGDYSKSVSSKTGAQIFTNTDGCHDDLNPTKFKVRESCDSHDNPESTPVIIGVDETGSMGYLATEIIKRSLGVVVEGIYTRKPVSDPHVLLAAIGDMNCDAAPIQLTQFEADVKIVEQIEKFYIEGNGGGNGGESYPGIWWFALNKTACDAISKKGRRGYLFTVGDESPHKILRKEHIKRFLDGDVEADVDINELLSALLERWHVFHLITPTGATISQNAVEVWKDLLGERAIVVDDHSKLGEVIVSTMQVNEGQDLDVVCGSWDKSTGLVVRNAVSDLAGKPGGPHETEVVGV